MRIALTSDLHGHLPPVPDCDLILIAQARPDLMRSLPWTYLDHASATDKGLRIWGSPATRQTEAYHGWAFLETDDALPAHYAALPDGTDIVLTHAPPAGILDGGQDSKRHSKRCQERTPTS